MPFTSSGSDIRLVRNERTLRFDLQWDATGNPVFDDLETHRVHSLLVERRGEWWADTRGNRGSQIHKVREIKRTAPSTLSRYASEALQKAVGDGKILTPTITAEKATPTRIDLKIIYITVRGKQVTATHSIGS